MTGEHDKFHSEPGNRQWTGGGYDEREGIVVTADAEGITVEAWYDGGVGLEIMASMTWAEVDALRGETR